MTNVNLNSILCPAVSDPFAGQWYRIAANIHQTLFFILHGKIYKLIGKMFFEPKEIVVKVDQNNNSSISNELKHD